jgi:hypothetical protein
MYSTRGAACVACLQIEPPSLRTTSALSYHKKKEAGFPAPLAMTTEVCFVFFLATVIAFAQSLVLRFAPQSCPA